MTTEKFSLEEFKKALPKQAVHVGIVEREHVFEIPLGYDAKLVIRSSVNSSGYAAETGGDSIRLSLLDKNNKPLAAKLDAHTKRTSGWRDNMNAKINTFISMRQQAGNCAECGRALQIRQVAKEGRNKGRYFATCRNYDHKQPKWIWIDLDKPPRNLDTFKWQVEEPTTRPEEPQPEPQRKPVEEFKPKPTAPAVKFEATPTAPMDEWGDPVQPQMVSKPIAVTNLEATLAHLDHNQRAVVESGITMPTVVEATAGSGKTRTMEATVAALIAQGANPERICAVTFSRKAAQEMRTRVAKTVWPDVSQEELDFFANPSFDSEDYEGNGFDRDWIDDDPVRQFLVDNVCTIHGLSYRILNRNGIKVGVLEGKRKLRYECDNLISDSIKELDWDESIKSVKWYFSIAINNLVNWGDSEEFFSEVLEAMGGPVYHAGKLAELYKRYRRFLEKNHVVDFDLMQAWCLKLIRTDPQFRNRVSSMFDYVIVDEDQDTSSIQNEILWTLAGRTKRILVVGDVDQAIYSFRGAVPEVMRDDFDKYWKDVRRFPLPINYRSTQNIVAHGKRAIQANYSEDSRYLKAFQARPDAPEGEPVVGFVLPNFSGMCVEIANQILQSKTPGNWFVLSRTRAECEAIHLELTARGIPAINKSGGLLFGVEHVRKVLAYARLACNYHNARNDLDILKEIANVATATFPAPMTRRRHIDGCNAKPWEHCGCPIVMEEGVDHAHARYYSHASVEKAGSWAGIVRQMSEERKGRPTVIAKAATDLVNFVNRVEHAKGDARVALSIIVDDCVLPWIEAEDGITGEDVAESNKAEDLAVLISMVKPNQTLEEYLEEIDVLAGKEGHGNEQNSVLIGTIHWSKGAERPCVALNLTRCPIIPPMPKPGRLPVGRPSTIAEERRLAFVGLTRAQEKAVLFASMEWMGRGLPLSPFMREILEEEIAIQKEEIENETYDSSDLSGY